MEDKTFEIELTCFYCDAPIEKSEDKEPSSGDLLKCSNCKELYDYDSLVDVAVEEGEKIALDYANEEMNKMLNKYFK